jgi:hypothetical protein
VSDIFLGRNISSSAFGLEVVEISCLKRDIGESLALDRDKSDEEVIGRAVPSVARMKRKIRNVVFIWRLEVFYACNARSEVGL